MGIRGNYPREGLGWLVAAWCWPLDVSSFKVKNKSSYTSTAPQLAFISKTVKFTITSCFAVECIRSLIPKDTVVLLQFYDFVHHWSKLLASKLIYFHDRAIYNESKSNRMKIYFLNLLLYSIWCPTETSYLIQVMVMCSLVPHPAVNKQNTI